MNIVYLTWGETPRSYGVFGSQVIGQFVETSKEDKQNSYFFVSAIPIVHSGLVREKIGYINELNKVKKSLYPIPFAWIPIYTTQNFVNSSKNTFKLMHIGAQLHFKNKFLKIRPDVVHCRSYHAAWAALRVKEKYSFDYKIIFDGRGLWPEEVSLKKSFLEDSEDYLFLKSIEKELLQKCDISVTVSDTMNEHYKLLGAKRTECIYLSASVEKLKPKKDIEIKNDESISFCYVGALSDDTWHQPKQLLELYIHIRTILPNVNLTIVTTSNYLSIKEYFKEIPENEIEITSTKTVEELSDILNKMDFGLLSYFIPDTKAKEKLGEMVLAVKTAEYLIAGLPVIVNKYCGGASAIVEKKHLGISYDPITFEEITKEKILSFASEDKFKISDVASELFSYKEHAKEYLRLYNNE